MSGERELLERRARELAGARIDADPTPVVEVVVLTVGQGRRFVIEARHVREVLPNDTLRRLPAGSGALVGMMSSRGEVVPVADLAHLLDIAGPDRTRPLVVVLDGIAPPVGLLVDAVSDVTAIPADQVPEGGAAEEALEPVQMTAQGAVVLQATALLRHRRLAVPRPEPLGAWSSTATETDSHHYREEN